MPATLFKKKGPEGPTFLVKVKIRFLYIQLSTDQLPIISTVVILKLMKEGLFVDTIN